MNEVKSCPFCGGKVKIKYFYPENYRIVCTRCSIFSGEFNTQEKALKYWNTRIISKEDLDKARGKYYIV